MWLVELVSIGLGVYAMVLLLRRRASLSLADAILYTIIISILLPFVPRVLPKPPNPTPVISLGIIIAGILKLAFYIIKDLAGLLTQITVPYWLGWLDTIANVIIGLLNMIVILIAIYTIAYQAWLWVVPVAILGFLLSLRCGGCGFIIAYAIIGLAIIAGVLAPFISVFNTMILEPVPSTGYFYIILTPRPSLIWTNYGVGFTSIRTPILQDYGVLFIAGQGLRITSLTWLWLRLNYTISPLSALLSLPLPPFVKVILIEPIMPNPITCNGQDCGAFMILRGSPSLARLDNGTVVITTREPMSLWLWASGLAVNATSPYCNYTVGPSQLWASTSLNLDGLTQLPGVVLPQANPIGYHELILNITGINATCQIRVYGVFNNTWYGVSPIAYTPTIASIINDYHALANLGLGKWFGRLLFSIFAIASVGGIASIGWDYMVLLLRRALSAIATGLIPTPVGGEEEGSREERREESGDLTSGGE